MIARPMIEVERDGVRNLLEYDVLRYFKNKDEALDYARSNAISDVDFS